MFKIDKEKRDERTYTFAIYNDKTESIIAFCALLTDARKIAKALNKLESKPN